MKIILGGFQNKKILLTGAAGFIGGHLAEVLLNTRARLFCAVREPKKASYFYQTGLSYRTKLIKCDLSEAGQVQRLLGKHQFDFIFHLAGVLRPKNIQEAFLGNVAPVINLLESLKHQKYLQGIIFASTVRSDIKNLAGGRMEKLMSRPYDFSKTVADAIIQVYMDNDKIPAVIMKYANVFGPGDDLVKPLRLTSEIMDDLKSEKTFVPNSSSKDKLEFLYVNDVAKAFVSVIKNLNKLKGRTVILKPLARYTVVGWADKIRKTVKGNKPKNKLEKAIIETYNWR